MMINDKCETCANRGKINGLSQETFCYGCIHHDNWKKNHYSPINKDDVDDSQQPPEAAGGRWQGIETAPTDSTVLLDVGLPYAVIGAWNEHEQQWIYAELEINRVDGNFNDPYFGNVYISNADVKGWMKLPEVDNAE